MDIILQNIKKDDEEEKINHINLLNLQFDGKNYCSKIDKKFIITSRMKVKAYNNEYLILEFLPWSCCRNVLYKVDKYLVRYICENSKRLFDRDANEDTVSKMQKGCIKKDDNYDNNSYEYIVVKVDPNCKVSDKFNQVSDVSHLKNDYEVVVSLRLDGVNFYQDGFELELVCDTIQVVRYYCPTNKCLFE